MGTRADFYIMGHDKSMKWIGSLGKGGNPGDIPVEILLETNETMFEELVHEFLEKEMAGVPWDYGVKFPWAWADSRLTDYSYILHICTGKVYVSKNGKRLMDPIKLIQGIDEIGADCGIGEVNFPIMNEEAKQISEEIMEIVNQYGSESTETL